MVSIYFQLVSSYFGAYNRVPPKQLYYSVAEPLLRYPFENCLDAVF